MGRPKHVAEYVEGKEAVANLKSAMGRLFAFGKPVEKPVDNKSRPAKG